MNKKEQDKLWTRLFGIKVGDLVRFKYGKVVWEVYAEGDYKGTTGKWKGINHYWKLRRKRKSNLFYRRDIIYRTLWEWEPKLRDITKVGEVGKKTK